MPLAGTASPHPALRREIRRQPATARAGGPVVRPRRSDGRPVGVDGGRPRQVEFRHQIDQLADRTNGRVADGPFRGTKLRDASTWTTADIRAVLGLDAAGPAGVSRLLASSGDERYAVVGHRAPVVVDAGLATLGFEIGSSSTGTMTSSAAPGIALAVCPAHEFDDVVPPSLDVGEVWIEVGRADSPATIAEIVDRLSDRFDLVEVFDPLPSNHHLELFRDLGRPAATGMRAVLSDRRRWIVALARPAT